MLTVNPEFVKFQRAVSRSAGDAAAATAAVQA
jgi:hypothetical protein